MLTSLALWALSASGYCSRAWNISFLVKMMIFSTVPYFEKIWEKQEPSSGGQTFYSRKMIFAFHSELHHHGKVELFLESFTKCPDYNTFSPTKHFTVDPKKLSTKEKVQRIIPSDLDIGKLNILCLRRLYLMLHIKLPSPSQYRSGSTTFSSGSFHVRFSFHLRDTAPLKVIRQWFWQNVIFSRFTLM